MGHHRARGSPFPAVLTFVALLVTICSGAIAEDVPQVIHTSYVTSAASYLARLAIKKQQQGEEQYCEASACHSQE